MRSRRSSKLYEEKKRGDGRRLINKIHQESKETWDTEPDIKRCGNLVAAGITEKGKPTGGGVTIKGKFKTDHEKKGAALLIHARSGLNYKG